MSLNNDLQITQYRFHPTGTVINYIVEVDHVNIDKKRLHNTYDHPKHIFHHKLTSRRNAKNSIAWNQPIDSETILGGMDIDEMLANLDL